MKYPDDYVVNYDYYNGTGLLSSVIGTTDSCTYATYTDYKPTGKIGHVDYANNTSRTFEYDPYSTRLTGYYTQDPNDLDLQRRSYTYSAAGDIESIVDQSDPASIITYTYSYDNLHRLMSETNTGSYQPVSYTYDNIGNITSKTIGADISSYTYDPADKPHAVKTLTGQLGNEYNFSDRVIEYNAESMPVSIVDIMEDGITTQTTLFEYDGNNTRVKKVAPNGIETHYVSNNYEVKDGQATKYIFGNNMRIAQVKGTEKHFFHKDHLMSSTVMSDASGAEAETTEYMPFGKTRVHTGTDLSDYKFTDQELDKSTGFYNYDARLYDPLIGRFVIADSIVPEWYDPQMLNRYSYVRNNPLGYVDPSGHWLEDESGLFGKINNRYDTLTKIVNEHNSAWGSNLTVDEVAQFNMIENKDRILLGNSIYFPGETWTASGTEFYFGADAVVGEGEPMPGIKTFEILGNAKVSFHNGYRVFRQDYDIKVLGEDGISAGVTGAALPFSAEKLFPKGASDIAIAESYEGDFYGKGGSLLMLYWSDFEGSGWRGRGIGAGFGFLTDMYFSRTYTHSFFSKRGDIYDKWDLINLECYD